MTKNIKELVSSDVTKTVTWICAFAGVCVLVGLGKMKPEAVEMLLFGLLGSVTSRRGNHEDSNR